MKHSTAARIVTLAAGIGLAQGCALTQMTTWQARPRHQFATLKQVNEAVVSGDTVAIRLNLLRHDATATATLPGHIPDRLRGGPMTVKGIDRPVVVYETGPRLTDGTSTG